MSLRMLTGKLLVQANISDEQIRWYAPMLSSENVALMRVEIK